MIILRLLHLEISQNWKLLPELWPRPYLSILWCWCGTRYPAEWTLNGKTEYQTLQQKMQFKHVKECFQARSVPNVNWTQGYSKEQILRNTYARNRRNGFRSLPISCILLWLRLKNLINGRFPQEKPDNYRFWDCCGWKPTRSANKKENTYWSWGGHLLS